MANYYNPYQFGQQNYQPMTLPQQQIQNGGLVTIGSEEEARAYPVAPGNCVTFKQEGAPYLFVKTMGFSQFDTPTFKKYKLVEEGEPDPERYANSAETEELRTMYGKLSDQVKILKKTVKEFMESKEDE